MCPINFPLVGRCPPKRTDEGADFRLLCRGGDQPPERLLPPREKVPRVCEADEGGGRNGKIPSAGRSVSGPYGRVGDLCICRRGGSQCQGRIVYKIYGGLFTGSRWAWGRFFWNETIFLTGQWRRLPVYILAVAHAGYDVQGIPPFKFRRGGKLSGKARKKMP